MSAAGDQLRAFVQRIERLDEEIAALNSDKSEVYKEAKSGGWSVKVLRKVVAARRLDSAEREEIDALFDLYMSELEGRAPLVRAHVENIDEFPPHDAVTGELTEEQEQPTVETHDAEDDVAECDCADRAPSGEYYRCPKCDAEWPSEEDPTPTPSQAAGQTGEEATTPLASSPVAIPEYVPTFLITKPVLRPHCLNPGENCGGQGVRHCHSCVKAMAESGVAA